MKILRSCALSGMLIAGCTILFPSRSHAQATTASVHGTVTDPNGAVLPHASVTALNTSTGIAVSQKTDSKGYFVFPDLHIGGPYSITVEDSGFQRFVANGIMLDLSSAREVDARLEVGSPSETVRVNSAQVEVESSDAQLKDVIGARELEDLPTLGRDAVQLQKTAPGTVEASDREATFSTNGSQTQENSYLLDGTDINDFLLNQPGITVNPDALAEINVISSTIDPEFSRNSGAIVDEALKSGTDGFMAMALSFIATPFSTTAIISPRRGPAFIRTFSAARWAGRSSEIARSSFWPIRGCAIAPPKHRSRPSFQAISEEATFRRTKRSSRASRFRSLPDSTARTVHVRPAHRGTPASRTRKSRRRTSIQSRST